MVAGSSLQVFIGYTTIYQKVFDLATVSSNDDIYKWFQMFPRVFNVHMGAWYDRATPVDTKSLDENNTILQETYQSKFYQYRYFNLQGVLGDENLFDSD